MQQISNLPSVSSNLTGRIIMVVVYYGVYMLPKCYRTECQNTTNGKQKYCCKRCASLVKAANFLAKHGKEKIKQSRIKYRIICEFCKNTILRDKPSRKFCNFKCSSDYRKKYLNIPSCLESADRIIDKNIGYVRVYAPMHPEANTRGYVYEHRLIAEEKILFRRLANNEIVHHKNGVRWDNRIENLEVMDYKDHSKLHGQRPEDLNI